MNRFDIQYFIGIFFVGIIVGGGIVYLFWNVEMNDARQKENELVDFVIADWTGIETSDYADFADGDADRAQMSASKELPMSRLGYFPDTVKTLAKIYSEKYNIPASVYLAQWALESSWGKNNLGVSNYLGHTFGATGKFSSLNKSVTRTETIGNKRTLQFTVYKNIDECFDVHGKYLTTSKHFRAAFYTNSAENFVRALSVYAEDGQYALKLITIIRRYKL
ncbi:MAG: glucosaminidase domain-containing protein [Bacteroidota bacterium]|nr:glucosaminidase domain-containing protein [Bacteroidota bacterium]